MLPMSLPRLVVLLFLLLVAVIGSKVAYLRSCDDVKNINNVLVTVAHPDDIETIAGGTVAFLSLTCKKTVSYLYTTNGDHGWNKNYLMTSIELAEIRKREALNAGKILGIQPANIFFLAQEDGRLIGVDTTDLTRNMTKVVRTQKPDLVITFAPEMDYATYKFGLMHHDHQRTGWITMNTLWPAARDYLSFSDLWPEYPTHDTPLVWLFSFSGKDSFASGTNLTLFELTPEYFTYKFEALLQHKSQYSNVSSDVYEPLLQVGKYVARKNGMVTSSTNKGIMAEAFQVVEIL